VEQHRELPPLLDTACRSVNTPCRQQKDLNWYPTRCTDENAPKEESETAAGTARA
jgi:hypothetical protein